MVRSGSIPVAWVLKAFAKGNYSLTKTTIQQEVTLMNNEKLERANELSDEISETERYLELLKDSDIVKPSHSLIYRGGRPHKYLTDHQIDDFIDTIHFEVSEKLTALKKEFEAL